MTKPPNKPFKRNVHIQPHHEIKSYSDEGLGEIEKTLKPLVLSIIEQAFKRYCNAHKATNEIRELEWKRFKKILNEML